MIALADFSIAVLVLVGWIVAAFPLAFVVGRIFKLNEWGEDEE